MPLPLLQMPVTGSRRRDLTRNLTQIQVDEFHKGEPLSCYTTPSQVMRSSIAAPIGRHLLRLGFPFRHGRSLKAIHRYGVDVARESLLPLRPCPNFRKCAFCVIRALGLHLLRHGLFHWHHFPPLFRSCLRRGPFMEPFAENASKLFYRVLAYASY